MTQHVESPSDVVAGRVQEIRKRLGWSVARLADECAKAGAPRLNANVLTNLLSRRERRRDVTVDELVALAEVLDVPVYVLLPAAGGGTVEQLEEEIAAEIADGIADGIRTVLARYRAKERLEYGREVMDAFERVQADERTEPQQEAGDG